MPENGTNYRIGYKSHFIRKKAAQNVFNAVDFALHLKTPLNLYILINLVGAPQYNHKMVLDDIMQKYRRWNSYRNRVFRDRDLPPLWVYTLENNHGNNPHVNWLVHVPDSCIEDFKKKIHLWCKRVLGNYSENDIHITTVNMDAYKQPVNYILKGIDSYYVARFHLEKFYKGSQGVVFGCRARPSNALNVSARKEAGFNAAKFRQRKMEKLSGVKVDVKGTKLNRIITYRKVMKNSSRTQFHITKKLIRPADNKG